MLTHSLRSVFFLSVALVFATMSMAQIPSNESTRQNIPLAMRGVYFVPNEGQWADPSIHYGLRSYGLDAAFRDSTLTLHMSRDPQSDESMTTPSRDEGFARFRIPSIIAHEPLFKTIENSIDPTAASEQLTLTITFPGSNVVEPIAAQPQSARFNYYVGGDNRHAAGNIHSFGEVIYPNLYDGIDLHITGSAARGFATAGNADSILKYEFHIAPGADYSQIQIRYEGIEGLCIDRAGNLEIATTFGTLRDHAPIAWQTPTPSRDKGFVEDPERSRRAPSRISPPESRSPIPAHFELTNNHTYHITIDAPTDPSRELVIDPDVDWMMYLGGTNSDYAFDVALDSEGNPLVTGDTSSTDFEGRNNSFHGGSHDAFVAKLDASGQLLWMTYFGGSDYENAKSIAVDGKDDMVIAGITRSTDFEKRRNAHHGLNLNWDPYLARVDASGQLQRMVYLGGSKDDVGYDMVLDSAGKALVTGYTCSTDFEGRINEFHGDPTYTDDAFVVKVDSAGHLQWMTYVGGSHIDEGLSIAADQEGSAVVSGVTNSADFERRTNSFHDFFDVCVFKVNTDGQVQWMTYFGGIGREEGYGIAVDSEGEALVTGYTESADFEGRNNSFLGIASDAFILKVSPLGGLQWMKYVGGTDDEVGFRIAADAVGGALMSGYTDSTDFVGADNSNHGGNHDAIVLKMSPEGQLLWMTYLGGSEEDIAYSIAIDDNTGDALVTGATRSIDFEGHDNEHHGATQDAFVVRLTESRDVFLGASGMCPGMVTVNWSGAAPNSTVALIYAGNTGNFVIPGGPCMNTTLGLGKQAIRLVGTFPSGANGAGGRSGHVQSGACMGYLQLLDLTGCRTSNLARIP